MTAIDSRLVRLCDPSCDGHMGKFRIMLAPPVTTFEHLGEVEIFDMTPGQLAELCDQFLQTPEGIKSTMRKLEGLLEEKS